MRTAIDRGLTFMDNSWDYNDGESERRMGKALGDGYRDKVFLMSKIDGRTRESAAQQIDESLRRLRTDRRRRADQPEIAALRGSGQRSPVFASRANSDILVRTYWPATRIVVRL